MILISNDDGAAAPSLGPLVRALAKLDDVRVAVPDAERSWIGKAISRFETVTTRRVAESGIESVLVSGTPADSVNLGVHSLWPEPPDLVVSGVNIGLNVGAAFFLSSGTRMTIETGRRAVGIPSSHLSGIAPQRWPRR